MLSLNYVKSGNSNIIVNLHDTYGDYPQKFRQAVCKSMFESVYLTTMVQLPVVYCAE